MPPSFILTKQSLSTTVRATIWIQIKVNNNFSQSSTRLSDQLPYTINAPCFETVTPWFVTFGSHYETSVLQLLSSSDGFWCCLHVRTVLLQATHSKWLRPKNEPLFFLAMLCPFLHHHFEPKPLLEILSQPMQNSSKE